jgi:hypothetical protein
MMATKTKFGLQGKSRDSYLRFATAGTAASVQRNLEDQRSPLDEPSNSERDYLTS